MHRRDDPPGRLYATVFRNSRTAALNASGASKLERCAAPGIDAKRAPRIALRIASASFGGIRVSSAPVTISVENMLTVKARVRTTRDDISLVPIAIPELDRVREYAAK